MIAAERPLVVVLEDLHWAEGPMLDLADAVDRADPRSGAVPVPGQARVPRTAAHLERGEASQAITTTLPPLSAADARRMAEHLLGAAPDRVVDRVCEAAEGNPLYLEQLTATLEDQGLLAGGRWLGSDDAMVEIPTTLQALLAARLDRLEPTPRLVLERASVEGRRFRIAALRALAPDVPPEGFDAAIEILDRRGLILPEDEAAGSWRFAHALVMEAAYRGLSKELRAELHERLADWMTDEDAEQPDVDESVARQLERALHLREELGAPDERSAALAERAGGHFASAGSRAFAAMDFISARDFLSRAAALLPGASPRRMEILPTLGAALADSGRVEESDALLAEAVQLADVAGLERDALRASVQILSNRVYRAQTDDGEHIGIRGGAARVRGVRGGERRGRDGRGGDRRGQPRVRTCATARWRRGGRAWRWFTASRPGAPGRRCKGPATWSGSRSWGRFRSHAWRPMRRSSSRRRARRRRLRARPDGGGCARDG